MRKLLFVVATVSCFAACAGAEVPVPLLDPGTVHHSTSDEVILTSVVPSEAHAAPVEAASKRVAPATIEVTSAPPLPHAESAKQVPSPATPEAVDPTPPPAAVWAELLTGNARFVLGAPANHDLASLRGTLVSGQHPHTIVLCCSDSRVPPELVFDQSLGDLFVVRTAGEAVDPIAVGSIEYAVDHLGARLIVVLGHEKCGAVTAALSGQPMPTPALRTLVATIGPAIQTARTVGPESDALSRAIAANVTQSAAALLVESPVLREKMEAHELLIVEAVYSLAGGEVRELARHGTAEIAGMPPREPVRVQDSAPVLPDVSPEAKPAAPPRAESSSSAAPSKSSSGSTASPIAWDASMRFRYEARSVLDYRLPGSFKRPATQKLSESGDQSLMRTRIGAGMRLAQNVRGTITLQDARVMGAEGSPSGSIDNVDLFQAYADIDSLAGGMASLRAGRQVFQYGDGRVVGGSEWGNNGRAWDGARLRVTPRRWQIDGLVAWVNEGRLTGTDRMLSGADALWKARSGLELEGYSFLRSFGDAAALATSGASGRLHDSTTGLRLHATHGRVDWKAEAATQQGRRAAEEVSAWLLATRATIEMPATWKPRLQAEWLSASGDRDPSDRKSQRYESVYWSGHGFLGQLDVVGCSNVRDLNGQLSIQPRSNLGASAEVHRFRLNEARDVWLDDAGTILRRSASGNAGTDLGSELDLGWKWDVRPRVGVNAGWSHFWAGDFVERTGGGRDLDWGFLQLSLSM